MLLTLCPAEQAACAARTADAEALRSEGRHEEAVGLYHQAVEVYQRMLRARKLDSEEALLRLHNCISEARRLEEAVDVQEELFALRRHVMRD